MRIIPSAMFGICALATMSLGACSPAEFDATRVMPEEACRTYLARSGPAPGGPATTAPVGTMNGAVMVRFADHDSGGCFLKLHESKWVFMGPVRNQSTLDLP